MKDSHISLTYISVFSCPGLQIWVCPDNLNSLRSLLSCRDHSDHRLAFSFSPCSCCSCSCSCQQTLMEHWVRNRIQEASHSHSLAFLSSLMKRPHLLKLLAASPASDYHQPKCPQDCWECPGPRRAPLQGLTQYWYSPQ